MARASLIQRIKALALDYLVVLLWMATLGFAAFVLFLVMGGMPDALGRLGPLGTQVVFSSLLTVPVGLWLYASESGAQHATLGKRKVGLRVVSGSGALTRTQILVRTLVKLAPWEIAHTFIWQLQYVFYLDGYDAAVPGWIFAGLIAANVLVVVFVAMVGLREDGRGPHDLLAGTRVITKADRH